MFPPNSADTLLREALHHAKSKDFQLALQYCKHANTLAPDRADIWAQVGEFYLELGHFQEGLDAADYAIALDPYLAKAYYVRGWARGSLWDFDGELADAKTGYALNPNSHELYYRRLARAHAGKGEWQYALTCCHLVLAFNPQDVDVLINRGGLYRLLKRYEEAIADFERVIDLAPNWYVPYYALGLVLIDANRYEAAINAFSNALESDPDSHWYPRILAFRAHTYELARQPEKAERDWQRAKAINPDVKLYGPPYPRPEA